MVWDTNAGVMVAQLRTELVACASWTVAVGAGNESARVHFPVSNPAGTISGVPDPLPHILIVQTDAAFQRYAEGGGGLPRGTLEIDLYLPATANGGTVYTAAQAETLADALIRDLMSQPAGIPFLGELSRSLASDPTPGEYAADAAATPSAYRTVRIRIPYGLNP